MREAALQTFNSNKKLKSVSASSITKEESNYLHSMTGWKEPLSFSVCPLFHEYLCTVNIKMNRYELDKAWTVATHTQSIIAFYHHSCKYSVMTNQLVDQQWAISFTCWPSCLLNFKILVPIARELYRNCLLFPNRKFATQVYRHTQFCPEHLRGVLQSKRAQYFCTTASFKRQSLWKTAATGI